MDSKRIRFIYKSEIKEAGVDKSTKEQYIIGIASTSDVDRVNDRVMPEAWKNLDLANKPPVYLYGHDWDGLPIGKFMWMKVNGRRQLEFKAVPAHTDFAQDVYKLQKDGMLPYFSVGFRVKEYEENDKGGLDIKDADLMEVSAVPVPANPNAALQRVKDLGCGELITEQIKKNLPGEDKNDPDESDDGDNQVLLMMPDGYDIKRLTEDFTKAITSTFINSLVMFETTDKELIEKPYESEHACRLKEPGQYESFRRQNGAREHDGKKYDVIYGIKDGESEDQAYRYPKGVWTEEQARAHCKAHNGAMFEPATGKYIVCNNDEPSTCDTSLETSGVEVDVGADPRDASAGDGCSDKVKQVVRIVKNIK